MKNSFLKHKHQLLFIISGIYCIAQVTAQDHQKFDPKFRSIATCEVIQNSIPFSEFKDYPSTEGFNTTGFIKDWDQKLQNIETDFGLWAIASEITGGGIKVLKDGTVDLVFDNTFTRNVPKGKLLTPYLKSLANRLGEATIDHLKGEFIDSKIEDVNLQIRRELDNHLVSQRYSKGEVSEDIDELKKTFQIYVNSQPSRSEILPIYNKIFLEKAFEYIDENRDNILQNTREINSLKTRFGKFEKKFVGVSDQVYQNKRDIKSNQQKIENLRSELTSQFNDQLSSFKESLANIASNQNKNLELIDRLGEKVDSNSKKISSLEKDMASVKSSLKEFDKKLANHQDLIEENAYYIDVISTYTYRALDLDDKVKAWEKKDLPFIKKLADSNPAEYQKQLDDLKDLQDRKDFVQIAGTIKNNGNRAYNVMVDNGWLKGKDAERVGKYMTYLNAAIDISIAYAAPSSATIPNAIFSTASLFGKKKKKGPSPEMKMLQLIYERMEQQFDVVNKKLDGINQKIDGLIDLNIKIHEDIIKAINTNTEINKIRFDNIDGKLDKIEEKVDLTLKTVANSSEALKTLIWKDISICNGPYLDLGNDPINQTTNFSTFENLQNYWPNCSNCVASLYRAAESNNIAYFKMQNPSNYSKYLEYFNSYVPTFDIYNTIYQGSEKLMNVSSSIPISKIDKNYEVYRILRSNSEEKKGMKYANITRINELLNPFDIEKFATYYLTFYFPYSDFLDTEVGEQFKIYQNLDDFYNVSESKRGKNIERTKRHILWLHKNTEKAIVQQTILSGHHLVDKYYKIIYEGKFPELYGKTFLSLRSNPILAKNFAKYTLNYNLFAEGDSLYRVKSLNSYSNILDLFEKNGSKWPKEEQDRQLIAIENLMGLKPLKFHYSSKANQVYLKVVNLKRKNEDVYIPVSTKQDLSDYKMDYYTTVYKLFDLRDKLKYAYLNVSIMAEEETVEGITPESYKQMFFESSRK